MSDCFDHEAAAWDSLNDYGVEEDGSELHPANIDPLYYHSRFTGLVTQASTEKSLLLKFSDKVSLWIPRKIIRNMTEDSMYIHTNTFNKIVKKYKATLDLGDSQ